jgi:hypothetical protein
MLNLKTFLFFFALTVTETFADISVGVPTKYNWDICTDEKIAKYVADQYAISAEHAFSAWDYMEKQGICIPNADMELTLVEPLHLVKGKDGGTARVFRMKDDILEFYWIEVK